MQFKSNSIQATPWLRQAGLCLLLVLYSLAAFKVDSFHALFHAQELKELHSAAQESNLCHKSIYHQESDKGCEHKSHFTENTKCPLCEYNVSADHLFRENSDAEKLLTASSPKALYRFDVISIAQFSHADRGPPAIN